ALDARQVLEIGSGREEEKVDASGLHPLPEPSPPLAVVEHHVTISLGATSRQRSSTPARSSIPCGPPKSTRAAPASKIASAWVATSAAVPANANRASTSSGTSAPAPAWSPCPTSTPILRKSSGSSSVVGSSPPTTSMYI